MKELYRLEAIDTNFGDDMEETSGRIEFRLNHFGSGTFKCCVTAKDDEGWNKVRGMLQRTSL
jgi:hypothetical protein